MRGWAPRLLVPSMVRTQQYWIWIFFFLSTAALQMIFTVFAKMDDIDTTLDDVLQQTWPPSWSQFQPSSPPQPTTQCTDDDEGEGWQWTMPLPGVPATTAELPFPLHGANAHGQASPTGVSPPSRFIPRVVKRSYKRALHRTHRDGTAWYKGRWWTEQQLTQQHINSSHKSDDAATGPPWQPPAPRNPRQERLKIFCWNAGGLSTERYQELLAWLATADFDVVTVVETRWKHESEWQLDRWHAIHSGTQGDMADGILVLISRKLSDHISWRSIWAGRTVHTKITGHGRDIDVLSCYQHVATKHSTQLAQRQKWVRLLDDTLRCLPSRNPIVITGDFNTVLEQTAPWVGTDMHRWQGHAVRGKPHVDSSALMQVIQQHELVALNTFDGSHPPTFVHDHLSSRIDFVLTRQAWADYRSKKP